MGNCIAPSRKSTLRKIWIKERKVTSIRNSVKREKVLSMSHDSESDNSVPVDIVGDIKDVLDTIQRGSLATMTSVRNLYPIEEEKTLDGIDDEDTDKDNGMYDTDCESYVTGMSTHNRLGKFDSDCGSNLGMRDSNSYHTVSEYDGDDFFSDSGDESRMCIGPPLLDRLDRLSLEEMGVRWVYGDEEMFLSFENSLQRIVDMSPMSPVYSCISSMCSPISSDLDNL